MLIVCVYVRCILCRDADGLVTLRVGECYVCKFKEGIGITNLFPSNQYFLLVECLYV
jgi:hypothetical protein